MPIVLVALIILLGSGSYIVGIWQMLQGKYTPSVFSRVIWMLLSVNSFIAVIVSQSSQSSILLAAIILIGNILMCLISFWKGSRSFGRIEIICVCLLAISCVVWIYFSAPLVNLVLSLVAHFIGGLPTIKNVWLIPKSESTAFWLLFFMASVLSIFASTRDSISLVILPLYFAFYNGGLFILTLRRRKIGLKFPFRDKWQANIS